MAFNGGNFCSVIEDQVCINFDHNIKVHLKLDDSIMVKDYDRNSSISVAGTIIPGMTRLFSINRDGFNVHHNSSDCVGIELSDKYDQSLNLLNNYPQVLPFAFGNFISLFTTDDEILEYNQMLSCEAVFHQQMLECNDDIRNRTRILVDSCSFLRTDNNLVLYQFSNGLEVQKCPAGHIRVYHHKINCEIMMGPYGISLISVGDTNIVANENDFHIVKGITNVTSINGLVRQFNST